MCHSRVIVSSSLFCDISFSIAPFSCTGCVSVATGENQGEKRTFLRRFFAFVRLMFNEIKN